MWLIVGALLIVLGSASATTVLFKQYFPAVAGSRLTQNCNPVIADNPVQAGGGGTVTYDCTTPAEFTGTPPPAGTAAVGTFPIADVYDSGKGEVFVTNSLVSTVSVISDVTHTVIATVPVDIRPDGVAYDSGTGAVFVVNQGPGSPSTGTVTVIPELPLFVPALTVSSLPAMFTPTITPYLPTGTSDIYVVPNGEARGATCGATTGSEQLISGTPVTLWIGSWDYCVDVVGTSVGTFSVTWSQ